MDTVKRLPQLGNSSRLPHPGDEGQAGGAPPIHHHPRPGHARGAGLEVERREGHLLILNKRRGQEQTELFLPS